MTIINPHNVRQLYFTWSALLLITVALACGSYYLTVSSIVPLTVEPVSGFVYAAVAYAGLAFILGLLFKYSFRRLHIAWGFFTSIAAVGLLVTALLDWNTISLALHGVGTISVLCFGPYLYFE